MTFDLGVLLPGCALTHGILRSLIINPSIHYQYVYLEHVNSGGRWDRGIISYLRGKGLLATTCD